MTRALFSLQSVYFLFLFFACIIHLLSDSQIYGMEIYSVCTFWLFLAATQSAS